MSKTNKPKPDTNTEMQVLRSIVTWFIDGEHVGQSALSIVRHMLNRPGPKHDYPRDPSDLARCLRLLEAVPEWRGRMNEMARHSPGWAGLCAYWTTLEWSLLSETGDQYDISRHEPSHTHKLMKLVIATGYRDSPGYTCTFNKDGSLRTAVEGGATKITI